MNSSEAALEVIPLIPRPHQRRQWKANPYWLIPVIMLASMARGLTMAPRIQVYTDIACRAIEEPFPSSGTLETFTDCSSSPAVQSRAAAIQASITTVMSILSATTTGPWSRLGDSVGRKPILFANLVGAMSLELVFLLATAPNTIFYDYAEQVLMLGFIIDGLSGGLSAFNGLFHAYISDCTEHGSRSKIFSTIQGLVFIGLAAGPSFGGIIMTLFTNNTYDLFYVSVLLLAAIQCYLIFFCPESLQKNDQTVDDTHIPTLSPSSLKRLTLPSIKSYLTKFIKTLLSPISMFAPRTRVGRASRDYNLTFVGLSLFLYLISIGVYQIKYLYAKHIYSWSSSDLGFYMSFLWVSRAINLLVIIPVIVAYFKPKAGSEGFSIYSEMHFDKRLAQCSFAVDGLADGLVAITPASAPLFTVLSCLNSFTSGGNPAAHSLGAVCLHASGHSSESGALFGAMAVLSAIAHTISPTIYAVTYGSTVAYFPKAIFCLAAAILATVVFLLSLVRTTGGTAVPYTTVSSSEEAGPSNSEDPRDLS
ncbi:MFS general substrate transporter [Guyanagaster necrorhizus]|uniref:MFS general substrate transporter n=1 Tax=Guyanagaster necrorhizus TaxID=856835 RepID=A0A9P7W2X2_9AGAR|nr:MFS general substrate transporter [Guyanagaster necrorhizus MCA 3950]KAG7451208.1 MFS general substrate transporter [Guyanagaster necrorhizus MCA 3950]